MKKTIFFCLLTLSTLGFAQDEISAYRNQSSNAQMPQQPMMGLKTSRPCSDYGVFVMGEFLYWNADQSALRYALNGTVNDLTAVDAGTALGSWLHLDPDWEPGVRVTLGWNTPHDDWDVKGYWTGYWNRSSETTTVQNNTTGLGLFTLWVLDNGGPIIAMSSASARYKLDYNMFDLELGRSFWVSRFLSMRPHIGVMGGWLNQNFFISYEDSVLTFPGATLTTPATFNGKSDYWGVGPKAGLNTNWYVTRTFSVYGNAAASLLFGDVDARSTQTGTSTTTGLVFIQEDIVDKFDELSYCVQLAMGLNWGDCFFDDKIFFGLSIGWEVAYWPHQFHLSTADNLFTSMPVTLKGITADAKLAF